LSVPLLFTASAVVFLYIILSVSLLFTASDVGVSVHYIVSPSFIYSL
jgi:hypothetical protein